MKRMGIVIEGVVLVVGCIFLLNQKDTREILITEEQELANTSLVFMLQDEEGNYNKSDTLPSTGYTLNASKSVCSDNATPTWEDNRLYINNLTKKGTSCYLYFDKKPMAMNTILADKTIDNSRSGAITGTLTTDTTGTIYSVADDWGTSYVYAGAPTDNWVKFAGYYWRIIRINGDGSIRMIYAGKSTTESGTDDQIQTTQFNYEAADNAFVGYMYGSKESSTYAETHANNHSSRTKGTLDTWYQNNIINKENGSGTSYDSYVSKEAGFCNDREAQSGVESGFGTTGYGSNLTTYAPLGRLRSNGNWKSSQTPSLKCSQIENDMFTASGSSKGNHKLTYPVGLITSDEVVLAGGFGGSSNISYYLYTGEYYWTMSPYFFSTGGGSNVFVVPSNGGFNRSGVTSVYGIRPVINLDVNVTLSGSGTSTDPYVVEGAM